MRRVFVTGIGVVTPIGIGKREFWNQIQGGCSGIRRITRFDASPFHSQVAGEVHGFTPEQWVPAKALKRMDRFSRFSVAAARMAVEDAGLQIEKEDSDRIGCFLGSALGGVSFGEIQYRNYHERGLRAVDSALALTVFAGAGSCNIAIHLGINGPTSANADSCASGPIAIGRALQSIRLGEADVIIAGASETPLTPLAFGAFDLIRAMSTHYNETPEAACRPFDQNRDGFVMAEGAAMLVLESEEHARNRGAVCLAEIAGYSLTNDGTHMTAPRADGVKAARAISLALQDAGCTPAEIDVVSAHGSSTPLNDPTETLALKTALGDHAYEVPVIGTKSLHGHSLGASGAIEAAIFSLGLYHQWLPGTLNLQHPSPECDLNYAQTGPVCGPFKTALSNSFGFGGINACLVMKAVDKG